MVATYSVCRYNLQDRLNKKSVTPQKNSDFIYPLPVGYSPTVLQLPPPLTPGEILQEINPA